MDQSLHWTRRRLTIIAECGDDEHGGTDTRIWLVAATIVALAEAEGLPGASVFHGDSGFGPGSGRPTTMIVIAGEAECIEDFATGVSRALPDALITVDDEPEVAPASRAAAMSSASSL